MEGVSKMGEGRQKRSRLLYSPTTPAHKMLHCFKTAMVMNEAPRLVKPIPCGTTSATDEQAAPTISPIAAMPRAETVRVWEQVVEAATWAIDLMTLSTWASEEASPQVGSSTSRCLQYALQSLQMPSARSRCPQAASDDPPPRADTIELDRMWCTARCKSRASSVH